MIRPKTQSNNNAIPTLIRNSNETDPPLDPKPERDRPALTRTRMGMTRLNPKLDQSKIHYDRTRPDQ